jgi:stress-induced-phosphoprotein 1
MVFYNNKAACYWELHDYDKCISQSQEALDIGMEHRADYVHKGRAYQRLGSSHLKKGEIEQAIAFFKKSMVEHSDKKVLGLLRDAEKQLEVKKQQAYYNPELAEKSKEEGNDFLKKHNFPEAVKCYTEAIKRDPSNHVYYSNRSTAYTSLLAFPEALKDANKCIELKPDFVKGYARKGKALFGMKEYKQAFEAYLKGYELDNNSPEIMSGMQKCREKLEGNMDEETVMRNIERDPQVQAILRDPMLQPILDEMKRDPRAASRYLNDPEVGPKLEKLIEVGVIRTK